MGKPSRRRRSVISTGRLARVTAAVLTLAVPLALVLAASTSTPAFAKRKGAKHGAGAHAAGPRKRVAVMPADGSEGADGPVRARISKTLKRNKIKVAGKPKDSAPGDDQGWMALARTLKVDGFIVPSYQGDKSKRSVEIAVRTASDGSVVKSETFTAKGSSKKLAAAVGKAFWKKLGSAVEQVSAPAAGQEGTGMPARDLSHDTASSSDTTKDTTEAEPSEPATEGAPPATESAPAPGEAPGASAEAKTPEDDVKEEGDTATPEPSPSHSAARQVASEGAPRGGMGPKLPALALRLALRFVNRTVTYTADPALPASTLSSATVGGAASWFPITHLGLEVTGEFASWLKYADRYPSVTSDLTGSLVFRWPLSFGEITAHAGGFRHVLALQDDGSNTRIDQLLPDLVYLGVRAGGGLSYHLTDTFTAAAEASYRLITDMNGGPHAITSSAYFPYAVPGPGVDLALTLAYRITPMIEIQAGFDMRLYVLSARGTDSTRIPATYLTDRSLGGWVGVGGVFGGH